MTIEVAVVGSVNHDLTVLTPRHPGPGETVLGRSHRSGGGGKGANQAVAAARLGSRTAMIGRVGDDDRGRALRASLRSEGIEVSCVGLDPEEPTGLAVITVDDRAENSIVVVPGANMALRPTHVQECAGVLAEARVVLAQLEIPLETVEAAAGLTSGVFCLNPAPARHLPPELLARVDVLVPNRTELAALVPADAPPADTAAVVAAVSRIEGPGAVVVTLGEQGCVVVDGGDATVIDAPGVEAVDTTGAGDAFCGALANALSLGLPLVDSARRATLAGAAAATRPGAQEAMPRPADLDALSSG